MLVLESELVNADLRQVQDKLEGQLNRLSQLNSSQNQLVVALTTQQQQNQAQELEKQAQIDQARQNLNALSNSYDLQKSEKLAQVNQARQTVEHSQTANKLVDTSLASSQREVERYSKSALTNSDSNTNKLCPALTASPSFTEIWATVPATAASSLTVFPLGSSRPLAVPVSSTLDSIAQGKTIDTNTTKKYSNPLVQMWGKLSSVS